MSSTPGSTPGSAPGSATVGDDGTAITWPTLVGAMLAVAAACACVYYLCWRRQKRRHGVQLEAVTKKLLEESTALLEEKSEEISWTHTRNQYMGWLVKPEELTFERIIGRGAFGEVWRGRWKGNIGVAIKKMFPLPGQATTAAASSSGGGGDDDDYDDMLDSELDYGSLNSEMRSVRRRKKKELMSVQSMDLASVAGINPIAAEMLTNLEVALMMRLRHPRLVAFLGAGEIMDPPRPGDGNFPRRGIFVMLEYVSGGDLAQRLKRSGGNEVLFPWSARLQCAMDIAEGMCYIHKNGLIHRDLKSMNVLYDHTGRCKIADLGLARKFQNSKGNALMQRIIGPEQGASGDDVMDASNFATAWSGTSQWMAPEVTKVTALFDMRHYSTYGKPSDGK